MFSKGALVLYKSLPARVVEITDKIAIEVKGGESVRVRPKDIALLHPGPVESFSDLRPIAGDVVVAWELVQGQTTTLGELAELAFGEFTPSTAWAAWNAVAEGIYFRGSPERIEALTENQVNEERARRDGIEREKREWNAWVARAREGKLGDGDGARLAEVEAVALKQSERSGLMKELGTEPTPENAHALLLRLGYWNPRKNPYPRREGMPRQAPELSLPALPQETRRDLTPLAAFAIDDEGSQDPDDALSWDNGTLWVHVADVAALISPDSPADLAARERGANLYLPEGVVGMLPWEATSELGLGLKEISPALSFAIRLSDEAEIQSVEITPSWVRVTRLTYAEAEAKLEESPFREIYEAALRFRARRLAVGSAIIDFPEVKIRVKDDAIHIQPIPKHKSRDLVAEMMLLGGEAAARFAKEHQIPFPYTTQPPPETSTIPRTLSEMFQYRKQLRPSQNKTLPEPHGGLGLRAYARATSPLRRYLDLVVHQQLRAHLSGRTVLGPQEVLTRVGAAEAVLGSVRRAERLSNQHWALAYLMEHPTWEGKGIVVEKNLQRGMGIAIVPDLGIETRIPLIRPFYLNEELHLTLPKVDLPRLTVRFRLA